jgi:hypothetical protein
LTGTIGTVTVGIGVSTAGAEDEDAGAGEVIGEAVVAGGEAGAVGEAGVDGEGGVDGGEDGAAGVAAPPLTRSAILFCPDAVFAGGSPSPLITRSCGFSRQSTAKPAATTTAAISSISATQGHGLRARFRINPGAMGRPESLLALIGGAAGLSAGAAAMTGACPSSKFPGVGAGINGGGPKDRPAAGPIDAGARVGRAGGGPIEGGAGSSGGAPAAAAGALAAVGARGGVRG